MKRAAVLLTLVLLLASCGFAGVVTIDTFQSQICFGAFGCGQSSQTVGGLQIAFSGASQVFVSFPSSAGNVGGPGASCVGGGFGCAGGSFNGLNMYVVITETSPMAGTAMLVAALSGPMSGTSGFVNVTYTTPSVSIGGTTFQPSSNF